VLGEPMSGTMTTATAYRAATLAGASAEALADQIEALADALREGRTVHALTMLEDSLERMTRFLTFLAIAVELVTDGTRAQVKEYVQRLESVLDKIEDALDRHDFGRLGLVLVHGLASILRDYDDHADAVMLSLAPARAA
jgi:hypothetical protein